MITKLEIKDSNNTPIRYLPDVFKNNTVFHFKKDINIIIGSNGCGKSTLMKLLYEYMLCTKSYYSQTPLNVIDIMDMFDDKTNKVKDGAIVSHDFNSVTFRLRPSTEIEHDDILSSMESFSSKYSQYNSSMGESMTNSLSTLFNIMFGGKISYEFPIKELLKKSKESNELWGRRLKSLVQYYKKNKIDVNKEDFEYTVLMDEPDRNLDVENITQLYNILSARKEMTQIIAVIHNPVLIYKLSRLHYVNVVEVEKGYLDSVKELILTA